MVVMLIFSDPDHVSPPQHFRTFVESPIGFVGRDNQGGLENARARTRPVLKKKARAKPKIPLESYFSGACIQFALRESVFRFASLAGENSNAQQEPCGI